MIYNLFQRSFIVLICAFAPIAFADDAEPQFSNYKYADFCQDLVYWINHKDTTTVMTYVDATYAANAANQSFLNEQDASSEKSVTAKILMHNTVFTRIERIVAEIAASTSDWSYIYHDDLTPRCTIGASLDSGFIFSDFILSRDNKGSPIITDMINYGNNGLLLSKNLSHIMKLFADVGINSSMDNTKDAKLSPEQQTLMNVIQDIGKQQPKPLDEIYQQLPKIKQDAVLLSILASTYLKNGNNPAYAQTAEQLAKMTEQDPAYDLILLDYYLEKHDSAAIDLILNRFIKKIGLFEASQDFQLSTTLYKDPSVRKTLLEQALQQNLESETLYNQFFEYFIEQKQYDMLTSTMNVLTSQFNYNFDKKALASFKKEYDNFGQFMKSSEFKQWLKNNQQKK